MSVLSTRRGRPRTFDKAKALDKAVFLFWKHGFDGTSIADLTAEIGVTAPTLYAAFGSKDELYQTVLDRYYEVHGGRERANAFESETTAFKAIKGYLNSAVDKLVDTEFPAGCMISTANLFHGTETIAAAKMTAGLRSSTGEMFAKKFSAAKATGELPKGTRPIALAAFYASVAQGMAVQAIDGASEKTLREIVDVALDAWPRRSNS